MKSDRWFVGIVAVIVLSLTAIWCDPAAWPQVAAQNAPAPAGQKVPDDIGIRIKNNQLDRARLENQMMQLSQQYQADQQAVEHGNQELTSLKLEALGKAKLDPATNDVDVEKLVFISKSVPPKPPEAKK